MFSRLLAVLAAALPLAAAAQMEMPSRTLEGNAAPRAAFRAPALNPIDKFSLPALLEKSVSAVDAKGRIVVGPVRELPKAAKDITWIPASGGFVAKLHMTSAESFGLRVKLELGTVPGAIEARVQGNAGRIEQMLIDPTLGTETWTPWTEGPDQVIELFSPVMPSPGAVRATAVAHFTSDPLAKVSAGTCTVSTQCTTNDIALDIAIAERKKSVARMLFVENGSSLLCTGTLINSERFPAAFFLTANHCMDTAASAATLTTFWFLESTTCEDPTVNAGSIQLAGGAQLVFTNYNVDSTLLQLNFSPPEGAVYSSWSTAELATGAPIVSISHPHGDTSRFALGAVSEDYRFSRPQNFYGVTFSRGIIEGGSSGSGLFQLSNGSLKLMGTLFGSTVHGTSDGLTCTNLNEDGLYGRFSIFGLEIAPYIRASGPVADDAPNRVAEFTTPDTSTPLDQVADTTSLNNRHIDYAGDLDLYRFTLQNTAYVSTWTEGTQDTVGSFLNSDGTNVVTNDDAQFTTPVNYNMGITRRLTAGTYYVQVGHYDGTGTGAYNFRLRADNVTTNYTDLWYNPAESGWGVNVNHQGNILFATIFTYGADGKGVWYSMSSGAKQLDGSYFGDLYRTTGPAFNAVPFTSIGPANATQVGTMRFSFTGDRNGVLVYNVGAAQVTKNIERIALATPPTCTWSAFDRTAASNYQDLWWARGGTESGWGVNITHQANTLFATLFTYDAAGQPMWLLMSNGSMTTPNNYSGALYRTTGPAFNAVPFTPITAANYTQVGNMSFVFTDGNTGTMTYTVNGAPVSKEIERLAFDVLKTQCTSN